MATKKQKREALEARKKIEAEEVRQSGLRAQAQDKRARELRAQRAKDEAEKINKRHRRILAMHGISLASTIEQPTLIEVDEYPAVDLDMTAETC